MKYLLKNLKVVARGEELDAGRNELVFDPAGKYKIAELKAIAKANGIEHGSKIKADELMALIVAAFEEMDLKEQFSIKAIVVAGVEADKSDDEIMRELADAGVPIRDVVGQFRTAMMAAGYLLKPKERNARLEAVLDGFEPETAADVESKKHELMDAVPRTTERQAMGAIRKYAKQNGIELPKVKRTGGFKKKVHDWMLAHPNATVDELEAFITDKGKPESVVKRYAEVLTLAQQMAKRISDQ